jgi:hypothetical protein
MHTDRRINLELAVKKAHVLFWKASGIEGDDHLIAKAVYRLSSIGAAQRIALSG